MYKTKVDWADSTWNPVTGCYHGCKYCYARRISERFGLSYMPKLGDPGMEGAKKWDSEEGQDTMLELERPYSVDGKVNPYPAAFSPTFHRYKLGDYEKKKGRTIFVCSMADLFGEWVPDEWIELVFEACDKAPQHRYLFLTKNPARYCDLYRKGILREKDTFWYGATFDHSNWSHMYAAGRPTTFALRGKKIHDAGDFYYPCYPKKNRFVSFEPLLYDIGEHIGSTGANWHIIGAETGNRKGKVTAKREWIDHIVKYSDENGIPVFMKESLRDMMGDDFRQEFPWKGDQL